MTKTVKVNFTKFWRSFNFWDLQKMFAFCPDVHLVLSDQPDLVFESVFKGESAADLWPGVDCIWYTGENVVPPLADSRYQYFVSFARGVDDDRHLRVPNTFFRYVREGVSFEPLVGTGSTAALKRRKDIVFLHGGFPKALRTKFVKRLMKERPVDCPGRVLNNCARIGGSVAEKDHLFRQYRYAICFENSIGSGYVTEKLPDAMRAGCIPIYWGDPEVGRDYNTDSFLDLSQLDDVDQMVEHFLAFDRDVARQKYTLTQSYFHDHTPPTEMQVDRNRRWFTEVLGKYT